MDVFLRISLLIPCYSEEKSIEKSIQSWLEQTRPADEIIVVDDSSTDDTPMILEKYKDKLKIVRTPVNSGNKSHAQEYGLKFVTGVVFVTTDGDTLLDKNFIKRIEEDFSNPKVAAVGGYVKSLKYNWLTACRSLDYCIGQNIDKLAQDALNFMFVIPGAAGAFRTDIFRKHIGFSHDTITEDLDFTYRLHKDGLIIKYDREAICYTQDPTTLKSYINQMRRWYGGGWQNLMKHLSIPRKPGMAFEMTLIYTEGIIFSTLFLVFPLINIRIALTFFLMYLIIAFFLATYTAHKEKRTDVLYILPFYVFLKYINAWIYLEQFVKEVIFRRKNLVWFKPERVRI
jgi:peptidoglycan-N-acetylglucosamine deacetylase